MNRYMGLMIGKMSAVTALYVLLTALLWKKWNGKTLRLSDKLLIGIIYGVCAVLSTHFGVDYNHMMLNVRDLGPLCAGLFFDPLSGILAGLIGGIERYIAGTWWGVGSYTRIACSVSTCLAGFLAAFLHVCIFKRKKPSTTYAFFMGAVMEVFHMYVVFITHRDDMRMAFYVVRTCSVPMILFSGLGLAACSTLLKICAGEWQNPFRRMDQEEIPLSHKFQVWLFVVTSTILLINFAFSFQMQTQKALQDARDTLETVSGDIRETVQRLKEGEDMSYFHVSSEGSFSILRDGDIVSGDHSGDTLSPETWQVLQSMGEGTTFRAEWCGVPALCHMETLRDGSMLLTQMPMSEIYNDRDAQAYETAFADILVFTVIYVLISLLVQGIVVNNLGLINQSLGRITKGNLDEVVSVRSTSEFASLSSDINQTVSVLKGYIEAAEKRIEQELELARTIQDSALPKNFVFPRHDFEIYATMDPAREVGGDFYDFFFVDQHKLALVIADVSGKGIPAALFMMRAKTAIRGLAESGKTPVEILSRANSALCEGNDAEMFVTVWLGIMDLQSGQMLCANAGHEYPMLMEAGQEFALLKDRHSAALAVIGELKVREYELQFHPGDRLFVYTDGVPEAIDRAEQQYGVERLKQVLNRVKEEPMETVLPAVREDISAFTGDVDQFDDITMIGFTWRGPEKEEK